MDGSIAVVAAPAPAPTNITFSVSGGNLTLNWPAGQGWQLQARTNSLTVGPLGACARCGAAVYHTHKSGQWLGVLSVGVSMIGSVGLSE